MSQQAAELISDVLTKQRTAAASNLSNGSGPTADTLEWLVIGYQERDGSPVQGFQLRAIVVNGQPVMQVTPYRK